MFVHNLFLNIYQLFQVIWQFLTFTETVSLSCGLLSLFLSGVLIHLGVGMRAPLVKKLSPDIFTHLLWKSARNGPYWFLSAFSIIKSVDESLLFEQNIGPYGLCLFTEVPWFPLFFRVPKKSTILISVTLFSQKQEKLLVVLKMRWKLYHQLSHAVQILYKNRWLLLLSMVFV